VNTIVESRRDARPVTVFEVGRRGLAPAHVDNSVDVAEERPIGPSAHDDESPIDPDALQALADLARLKRATMSWFAPQRAYYRGVEAAAEQVLRPEVASVRYVGWLDRYNPAFISGYLETIALLAPAWRWPSHPTEPRAGAA
jgi:hypothetical protein